MKHATLVFALLAGLAAPALSSDCPPAYTTSAADFVERDGMCLPTTADARRTVRELQIQLNKVAAARGFATAKVSGIVGPGTLKLYGEVQAISNDALLGDTSSCLGIAIDADVLADDVAQLAATLRK